MGTIPVMRTHRQPDAVVVDGIATTIPIDGLDGRILADAVFRVARAADLFNETMDDLGEPELGYGSAHSHLAGLTF
jgi:hypothetical protein